MAPRLDPATVSSAARPPPRRATDISYLMANTSKDPSGDEDEEGSEEQEGEGGDSDE
jgi:hypothetical protein